MYDHTSLKHLNHLLFILMLGSLSWINFSSYANATEPAAFSSWARSARIGGAAIWLGMTDAEMNTLLNNLANQNVSVIEANSDLSNYLTDAEFNQELNLIKTFSQKAHAHPNKFKVVWYYPSLEVLTPNVASSPHSMAKDHPDWIQIGLDGTPNVFVGDSGQVFWVDPGMESAWMSPSSPYRDYFFARVGRIAKETGVDGIWADVPLYSDFGSVRWADVGVDASSEFVAKYPGAQTPPPTTPATGNWTDPSWRTWIVWRHEELRRFLADAAVAARRDNPEFAFIVETLPTDYAMSTVYGLEGVDLQPIEGVTHVWKVDTLSNNSAMRRAREDDWISYISMQKYIKAASGNKPAWSFAYGKQANDAELVMAEILAAGNNPYELKIPEMTTTVGAAYRTKMFGWIKANESLLWQNSSARVAVLYSPASRDFVDQAKGEGMYTTTAAGGDSLWWNDDPTQSAYQRQYIAEYRGMIKLLVHNHIPFDSVIKPTSAVNLAKYQAVILPDLEALSDTEANIIRTYVNNGGHVIVTGSNPTGMDEYGNSRIQYALSDVLGINKGGTLPASKVQAFGNGDSRFFSALLGKKYFTNAADAASAATTLLTAINQTSGSQLVSSANKKVHMELSNTADGNKYIIQYVNFIGVTGTFTVIPATAPTTFKMPAGKDVVSVELTSPDNTTFALSPLAYTKSGQDLSFTVPVKEFSVVAVTLKDSGSTVNTPPQAVPEMFPVIYQGESKSFTASSLLANDYDIDGDPLMVINVSPVTTGGGSIVLNGSTYSYTPLANFIGLDQFSYTISDGRGGTSNAVNTITVQQRPGPPLPVAVNDNLTTTKDVPLIFDENQLMQNDSFEAQPRHISGIDKVTTKGGTVSNNPPPCTGIGCAFVLSSFTYKPPLGFTGTDSFAYTITDAYGATATATVTVTVNPAATNRPPVAVNDSLATMASTPVNFTAAQLLVNDSDPDNNPLTITTVSAPSHGVISGSYTYTPAAGYTGSDSFTYTISDGQGGTATATVMITVNATTITPKKYFPQAISILTGSFDSGSMASFTASDGNTYDIKSAYVAANTGGITDWYGKTVLTDSPSAVTALTVTYAGQYSKTNVTQQFYLYNFTTASWDLFDTRSVGNTDDVTVTVTVSSNPQRYISAGGEIRAQVKGFRAGAQSTTDWVFFIWANYLSFDVK